MGQTITEKILAEHSKDRVEPGEFIRAKVDLVMANEITGPIAIDEFMKIRRKVFDPEKIIMIPDHFTPCKDIASAELCKRIKKFAKETGVKHYEVGRCGIEHVFLPEQGFIVPGDMVIGGDSHTCTYGALGAFSTGMGSTDIGMAMATGETWLKVPESIKIEYYSTPQKYVSGKDIILHTIGDIGVNGALYKVMEFSGAAFRNLPIENRFTICNMAIETGAKTGIFEPDEVAIEYVRERTQRSYKIHSSDKDAEYSEKLEYDLDEIEPQVAFPHSPENVKPVSEAGDIPIDQVMIGSCTNGRIEDMRIAAQFFQDHKVADDVRAIIIPGSQEVYLQCIKEGLTDIFIQANAFVSGPTCGPCLGGHMGVLGEGEKCVSTTNRNFVGRMGHKKSEVYLASPATAAASAIEGKIADPREVMKRRWHDERNSLEI